MRIATWNVNSINARLATVERWVEQEQPDVVCMQELKCMDEKFPAEPFERLGYNIAVHGQKTYNGVAILSKRPLEDVRRSLPGDDSDDHARYIEAVVSGPQPVRSLLRHGHRTRVATASRHRMDVDHAVLPPEGALCRPRNRR